MKKDFVHVARDLGPVISQNIDEEEKQATLPTGSQCVEVCSTLQNAIARFSRWL